MLLAETVITTLLIAVRISGLFISAPFFSSRLIPMRVKIGFVFLFALVVLPIVEAPPVLIKSNMMLIGALAKELLVGYLLGLMVTMVFSIIQIAGRFIDFQIGFAIVNIIDPQYGTQVPLTGQFAYIFTVLVFLTINGHHYLIMALNNSFSQIPLLYFTLSVEGVAPFLSLFYTSFLLAVQISLPVVGALFLASVALGIVARTVPQMNVFVVGMPAKILLGFLVLMLAIPAYLLLLERIFGRYLPEAVRILYLLLKG